LAENSIKVGILTISDKGSQGLREDRSGEVIKEMVAGLDSRVVHYDIVPDEKLTISAKLREWADSGEIDLILTTGGTGLTPRDVTPEATLAVLDREAPGFAEAMRMESLKKTPFAVISRAVAGVRKLTLIINLPGSPKAVQECLEVVMPAIPHAVDSLKGYVGEHISDEQLAFIEIPTGIDKRHEPVIKGKGVPVWALVSYVITRQMTPKQISDLWEGFITEQEVEAAIDYWRAKPEAVQHGLKNLEPDDD